nr:uncharacterized protein LOC113842701 [Anas platyrhynchos]
MVISRIYHGYIMDISQLYHGYIMDISRIYHGYITDISRLYRGYITGIHPLYRAPQALIAAQVPPSTGTPPRPSSVPWGGDAPSGLGFGVLVRALCHFAVLATPTAPGAGSWRGTVAFAGRDRGESCWHGSELGLSVGAVSKVAITKAKVDFSGVVCLPPSVIAGNGLDGGGAGENDDEPVLVSLSAAPSPQSEAVANELQELSLQPELTLSLHHGRNPNLPPLSERKNGSKFLGIVKSSLVAGKVPRDVYILSSDKVTLRWLSTRTLHVIQRLNRVM